MVNGWSLTNSRTSLLPSRSMGPQRQYQWCSYYLPCYLLQGFRQQVHNHHTASPRMDFVMHRAKVIEQKFIQRTGRRLSSSESVVTSAAAVTALGDFALEYPLPLAPKVQVCVMRTGAPCMMRIPCTSGCICP